MKAKRFKRTRAVAQASAVALVTAALAFSATSRVLNRPDTKLGRVILTASQSFTITSTISSSSSAQTAALLYPGTQRYLWYTVHNPLTAQIKVLDLNAVLDPAYPLPAGCDASNLDLSHVHLTGTTSSPVATVNGTSTGTAVAPISMINKTGPSGNQDGCKNFTFHFLYSGSAQYTEVYSTSTAVTSSQNPSTVGQSVTYTATVTGVQGSGQDPLPNSPTGTVTFKDGSTTICSANIPVATASATTSTAQCTPPTYVVTGTHPITAVYSNSDGNFSGSTSPVMNQVVNAANTTTVLTSAPNPSTFGQPVTLTATVTPTSGPVPTGTVSFYLGTPTGTHSLLGTGTLSGNPAKATFTTSSLPGGSDSLYAVYAGNGTDNGSTSAVITQTVNYTSACITTNVNGGLTVTSGQSICVKGPGRVNGGVTVQAGGSLTLDGATVNGGVTATNANALRFCGSNISGGVNASGTTGFVMIGDKGDDGPITCAANTITGGVTLTNGHGGFEIAGNNISGGITVSGNTGTGPTVEDAAPEIEGNTGSGGLTCATTNNPAVTNGGQTNSVTGTKSGQCAGAGF